MSALVVSEVKNCIGCRLCVLFSSFIRDNNLGLGQAFIHLSRSTGGGFDLTVDPGVVIKDKDLQRIARMCPRNCFRVAK